MTVPLLRRASPAQVRRDLGARLRKLDRALDGVLDAGGDELPLRRHGRDRDRVGVDQMARQIERMPAVIDHDPAAGVRGIEPPGAAVSGVARRCGADRLESDVRDRTDVAATEGALGRAKDGSVLPVVGREDDGARGARGAADAAAFLPLGREGLLAQHVHVLGEGLEDDRRVARRRRRHVDEIEPLVLQELRRR